MPDPVMTAGTAYNDFLMAQPFSQAGGFPQVFNLGGSGTPLVGFTVANPAGGSPILSPYFSTHVSGLPGYNPGATPVSRPVTTLGSMSSGTPGNTGPTLGSARTSPFAFLPQLGGGVGGGGASGGVPLGGSPGAGPDSGFLSRYGGVLGFANTFGGGGNVAGNLAPQGFATAAGASGFAPNWNGMSYPNYVGAGRTNIYDTPLPYGAPTNVYNISAGYPVLAGQSSDPTVYAQGGDPGTWSSPDSGYATPGLAPYASGMTGQVLGGGSSGPTSTIGAAPSGSGAGVSAIAHQEGPFARGGTQAGDWYSRRFGQGVVQGQSGGPLANQQDLDFLLENDLVDEKWASILSGVVTNNEAAAKRWAEALRN